MVRILHAADFHLDSAFRALSPEQARQRRAESRRTAARLVEYGNDHGTELLLLAGDLFDSSEIYGQTAEELAQALASFHGQVVIAPGNHDCVAAASPYVRTLWPDNVHIFTTPQITRFRFPQYGCTVYGAAFTAPEVTRGASLAGIADGDEGVAIGLLHGEVGKSDSRYCPIDVNQIAASGLDYLALYRPTATLSGGEAQRIRLATQIGSGLVGVAYILDEPSIGLHQRDNDKLIATLKRLRDLGNSLIVVEHDEDTMLAADYIVDIGPGAGEYGGEVVAAGTAKDIMKCKKSITGAYLSGRKKIPVPETRRTPTGWITVTGARENNLKNIDVKFPLGVMTCVTGVSGSGKSSLVNEILYKHLARDLNSAKEKPGKHDDILGIEQLDKVINIDQSPIGRTSRSNPATYTGVFDMIRDLFASSKDAKAKGYGKGRFSFNVSGGRCEACKGDGIIKIEMHFLPDVYVPCEVCHGKRYNRETLDVKYKGKSIADVLDMTVDEACVFFENLPSILRKIETLRDVGLGYIKLGQPSTALSGGEAQRIKLATELSKRSTGRTIYILDEPTTGLHFADVHKLIDILQRLTEGGNTVVVIEHNLDVIKTADYIIDIGPEGGAHGGTIVTQGTPEEVVQCPESYTGKYLEKYLTK